MTRLKSLICILLLFSVLGCSPLSQNSTTQTLDGQSTHAETKPTQSAVPNAERSLTVYTAASLTGAFQEIGQEFEADHPGVKVNFNFAGSQILRTQLEQGGQADVFASADHKNLDSLINDNLITAENVYDFAINKMIVILPASNPGDVQQLEDLVQPGIKLILADASVPAGNYARQILTKMSNDPAYGSDFTAQVLANVVSNETDVKQVVAKIELGEADAGIVYASDTISSPELKTIPIPDQFNIIAHYPIAVISNAPNPDLAKLYVDFVLSTSGQTILKKWGFNGVSP
jgi:molybdate transport system substrate-binding protein